MKATIQKAKLSQNQLSFVIQIQEHKNKIYIRKEELLNIGYETPNSILGKEISFDENNLKENDGWSMLKKVDAIQDKTQISQHKQESAFDKSSFSQNEHALIDIDKKLENNPVYKKMLNNLLGLGSRDNSTFVSSRANNFDVKRIVSDAAYKKLFSQSSFKINIDDINIDNALNDLKNTSNIDEFLNVIDSNGILLSIANRRLLSFNFLENKKDIISKISMQKNKKIAKWKRFRNKYLDQQALTNSWPLYIGTMFIKVSTIKAKMYAPLLIKKVMINISNRNQVTLETVDGEVEINEKLLFLLQNEYKFNLPKILNANLSFDSVIDEFSKALSPIIKDDFNFKGEFEQLTKNQVTNQRIEYAEGATLSIMSPSGGMLRDKLIELIHNNDLEDMLDFNTLKNINKDIKKHIETKKGVYRITPTDISQEKAIIGSLKDHAIIWGPPGTGKSQTIANIIANILHDNKTAIISSQKKAALDVIQKRMGKLGKYMFFGLTDKNVNKDLFYQPFKELMKRILVESNAENITPSSLITSHEWDMFAKEDSLKDEKIDLLIKTNSHINNPDDLNLIKNNHAIIKKSTNILSDVYKVDEYLNKLDTLNIKKKGLFRLYPRDIRKLNKVIKLSKDNYQLLSSASGIVNVDNIVNWKKFLEVENKYKNSKNNFESDEDYIDDVLANRFKNKLEKMMNNPETKKEAKSFMTGSIKGWRIPYKFVNIYKNVINELYSVFVSTPQTLSASVDMKRNFDYAIFDEASQMHLEKAVPFVSMAKKSIIAGDSQQMRPTNFFGVRDNSELDEEVEEDVQSLLDYAVRKGLESREYMLTKNYRSNNSELMTFSSKMFYDSKLDVIDHKEFSSPTPIEVFNVKGTWEGRQNAKEATAALKKLMELAPKYEKIILLTLNSPQKQYIESLIYSEEKYAKIIAYLESGKVYLRNLENIQGDEANLVIVSVAYDKSSRLGSTYVARPEGKNALNVAISRAIDKMIVFKSISSDEVSSNVKNESIQVFRDWLSYLELEQTDQKTYSLFSDRKSETFDSTFEEEVFDHLLKNLKTKNDMFIQTQFEVGTYKIDMAIVDSKTNRFILGIEVDGYKWHSGFEKMMKDIERQRFIEAKGYNPIYRITELNWKTDPQKVIKEISMLL